MYEQFRQVAMTIKRRGELQCSLPCDELDRLKPGAMTKDTGNVLWLAS